MKLNHYITTLAAATALTTGAQAVTVFEIDLQMTGGTSQETQAGWTGWNVGKPTTSSPIATTVAGVGVSITANGTGGVMTARGGSGELRGGEITGTSFDDVVEDFAVARNGTGAGAGTATLSLTGLNDSLTYTLTLLNNDSYNFGANPGFAGGTITPSVTTGSIVGVADTGLITNVKSGARTDGDFNSTVISFTSDGGSADILYSSSSNFVVFSGLQLESVPEPSSTALLGLGGLALILRRRK